MLLQQQCFVVEFEEDKHKLHRSEIECIETSVSLAKELQEMMGENQPYVIRYTCEEVEII